MSRRLCLFGGGEHARVVAEAATLGGWEVVGAWSPEPASGIPWLGDDAAFALERERWQDALFHIGFVGHHGARTRRQVLGRWDGLAWASVVHPTAFVAPSARLGAGVFVGPRAVVHTGATIGDHAIINSGVIVEHDAVVGTGTHLAPATAIGGGARLGDWVTIGLGAVVRDHITIGDGAQVGMGAAVVADVRTAATVLGVPARMKAE